MVVQNQDKIKIALNAKEASSMLSRMKGLMFSKEMKGFDGLFIKPCNSIHTFFMNYPIDVLFLNKEMEIIKIKRNLRPWRMTRMYLSAHQVLELNGGSLDERILEGDKLEVICTN
ncbi:MAG: uncharacterized membrane protein (UPF0127 family) [Bacteriovoracaceae bacterium]|jgi:uncharacterized membrane protein (UPF0127 family)